MTSEAPQGDRPGTGDGPVRPLAGRVRPGAPRVAALDALLREVDGLRTTLQTDLSLAAGAVEAGAPDLAAHLLSTDRDELASFEQRALAHLRALEAADAVAAQPPAEVVPLAAAPASLPARRARRRLTRLLPAAPLVAAAAAVVGLLGVVPDSGGRTAPEDLRGEVMSSWQELTRLSATDAPADEVQAAARSLNAEIATMVAQSEGDPAAARQALALLREAQQVLTTDDDAAALQGVLQQSRALAARLLATLPSVLPSGPGLPLPAAPPVVAEVPDLLPTVAPRPRRSPAVRPAGSTAPRPTTSARPAPQQSPAAAPTKAPAPQPSATRPASPAPTSSVPPFLPGPIANPF